MSGIINRPRVGQVLHKNYILTPVRLDSQKSTRHSKGDPKTNTKRRIYEWQPLKTNNHNKKPLALCHCVNQYVYIYIVCVYTFICMYDEMYV